MRVAALVLGLIGGLIGLGFASAGQWVVLLLGVGGMSTGAMNALLVFLWALPIGAFVGGAVALNNPVAAGVILLSDAIVWLGLGASVGQPVNPVTGGPLLLTGVASFLAFAASSDHMGKQKLPYLEGQAAGGGWMFTSLYCFAAVLLATSFAVLSANLQTIFQSSLTFPVMVTYIISPLTFITYAAVVFGLARILLIVTDTHRQEVNTDDVDERGRDREDQGRWEVRPAARFDNPRGRRPG